MNEEFLVVVSEEPVGLVSSVVLRAETPVYAWEDGLVFEAYYAEDTAAYSYFSLKLRLRCRARRGLYAFSTFLVKKHGRFLRCSSATMEVELTCFLPIGIIIAQFSQIVVEWSESYDWDQKKRKKSPTSTR